MAISIAANAQTGTSLRRQMDLLHSRFGVDFVYDSSIETGRPYTGASLSGMRLKDALGTLFKGTGITFTLSGRYVMLHHAAKEPEPKREKPVQRHTFTLSGFVKDEGGESLINATVYDITTGSVTTTTNNYGFYSMTLTGGRHRVRFSYIGFDDRVETVEADRSRTLDMQLRACANLDEVIVTGDMNSPMLTTQTGRRSLTAGELHPQYALLSSPDMIKTLQRTSGVSGGTELSSGMYVHGGNDDENLFLLDGVPIYQINHTLGLFSAFNPDVIKNVDFYKSGFPARYGGRLSSVTDVRTKDGDMQHTHGSYNIGFWNAGFQIDGPVVKDRTSFNIGVRTDWMGLLIGPAQKIFNTNKNDKTSGSYIVHDLNAKLTHVFNKRSRAYVSLYSGMDWFWTKYYYRSNDHSYTDEDDSRASLSWGNLNLAVNWNYVFTPRLFANFSGLFTYNRSIYTSRDNERYGSNTISVDHYDHSYRSKIFDTGFRADFDYRPNVSNHIRFGTDYTLHRFLPQTQSRFDFSGNENQHVDTIILNSRNRHTAHEMNLYAEDEISLSSRWNVNLGAHASMFAIGPKTFFNIDPRAALKYQASAATALKLSFTGMTQYVHRLGNTYISMPTDYWVPTTGRLQPMRSWQLAAGIYNRPGRGW